MRFLLLLALSACFCGAEDSRWRFFHPELVKRYKCSVEDVSIQQYGTTIGEEKFVATASAERAEEEGTWTLTVGQFEHSVKGRHEAEKACSKWMDQATKRIKAIAK